MADSATERTGSGERAETARGGLGTAAPDRGPRNPVADRAAWALARLALLIFRFLPAPCARGLGRALGQIAWACSKRYRRQVQKHMDVAYRDEVSRAQKAQWCRKNFEHIGLSLIEFARMAYLRRETLEQTMDLSETRIFDELLARKKGVLCVPAHHGNWELAGYVVALKGYPLISVARPLDNPLLNEMIDEVRQASGNEIIHKWKVLWKLKKLLDGGSIVTMSVDQNGGVAGIFAPVFGVMASTVASPAELLLATGAPIVVCTLNRQADGVRHKLHVWDVIERTRSGNHEADRLAVITRINAAYEKAVRTYPEQWLWVHRRWKTRPPGEAPGLDGLPPRVVAVRGSDSRQE